MRIAILMVVMLGFAAEAQACERGRLPRLRGLAAATVRTATLPLRPLKRSFEKGAAPSLSQPAPDAIVSASATRTTVCDDDGCRAVR